MEERVRERGREEEGGRQGGRRGGEERAGKRPRVLVMSWSYHMTLDCLHFLCERIGLYAEYSRFCD